MSEQPKRIQRKRTKGWKMPENTVYVGRPTRFGNPFNWQLPICGQTPNEAREYAVELYRHFLAEGRGEAYPTDEEIRSALAGKDLACWCPCDQACHADVLLELANAP